MIPASRSNQGRDLSLACSLPKIFMASAKRCCKRATLLLWGTTDNEGRLSITSALPYGHYEFRELDVSLSYYPNDAVYPVDLSYPGSDTAKIIVQANQGKPILNKLIVGDIQIIKEDARKPEDWPEDDLSYRIQGAKFIIQNEALGLSFELVTDETGVAKSPLVPCGEWVVLKLNRQPDTCLLKSGKWQRLMPTQPKRLPSPSKTNQRKCSSPRQIFTTGAPVPGATIEIYDAAGNVVFTDVTSETGQVHAFQLPADAHYTFRETLSPNGHALNPNTFSFDILPDGTVSGVTEFTDDVSRIRVLKIDAVTKQPLAGVSFGLYNQAGEQLQIQKPTVRVLRSSL